MKIFIVQLFSGSYYLQNSLSLYPYFKVKGRISSLYYNQAAKYTLIFIFLDSKPESKRC